MEFFRDWNPKIPRFGIPEKSHPTATSVCNPLKTLRIECPVEVRERRGFQFTTGIDDKETECGLDNYPHDIVLHNSTEDGIEATRLRDLSDVILNHVIRGPIILSAD